MAKFYFRSNIPFITYLFLFFKGKIDVQIF